MRFPIPKLNIAYENFLRHCGYLEIRNPHKNNEISYARSLLNAGRNYPRFHIYPVRSRPAEGTATTASGRSASNGVYSKQKEEALILDIHLDAKQPSYEGASAHSGEYEGKLIEDEAARVQKISEQYTPVLSKEKIGFARKTWLEKILDLFS